jgi:hypothetical protein
MSLGLREEWKTANRVKEAERRAAQERAAFENSPVGLARAAFERGDRLFQFSHDVVSQTAYTRAGDSAGTKEEMTDPSETLNRVADEGWELVTGSFVFQEEGSQSRDKFLSSGQQIAVKGRTVGFYLFRRCEENRRVVP